MSDEQNAATTETTTTPEQNNQVASDPMVETPSESNAIDETEPVVTTATPANATAVISTPPPPSRSKRSNIAHEIASSEGSYVRSLELLVTRYVQPIVTAEPEVLNAATRRELSASLSEILAVHRLLLAELEQTIGDWSDATSRIGPHFIKFAPYFKLYNEYCANYNSFMSKINAKLAKADHPLSLLVDKVANELRAEANLRLDLASFLIMPVQRLPRYRLLLTELVDATAADHADHATLTDALGRIAAIAQQVNASVAARANRDKLVSIAHELRVTRGAPPAIVEPQRTFIREGELRKLCRKGVKRRRVWLFSDSLLYATPSDVPGTRISIKPALLSLRGASVAEVPANSLAIDDVTPYALQISTPTKSFIAYCESTDERNGWLEALIGVILKLGGAAPGAADAMDAPIWVPDDIAHNCMVCDAPFTWNRRRHHCFREADHQILTNCGFLFLDDVERIAAAGAESWARLRVASYDAAREQLVYQAPLALVVNESAPQDLVLFRSDDGVALAATADHQMWAARAANHGGFGKVAAAKLVGARDVSFLGAARNGARLAAALPLSPRVCELYGLAVALHDGVAVRGDTVSMRVRSRAELEFVAARVESAPQWRNERVVVMWSDAPLAALLSRDVEQLTRLSTAEARAVVVGLRATGEASAVVASARVRDAVVTMLVHAGLSPSFAAHGKRWRVAFGDDESVAVSSARLVRERCRTWCFDMDDGFVVVRSAQRRGAALVSASRPTVQGNCRRCGKVCCAACSTMRTTLANIGEDARVCDHCFTAVTGEAVPDAPKQDSTWDKFGLSARGTVALRKWSSRLFEPATPPPVPPKKAKPLPAIPTAPAEAVAHDESDSDDLPPPVTPGVSRLLAVFSYEAVEENELSFEAGALIEVLEWDADSAWWVGKLADERTGLVPINHCVDAPPVKVGEPAPENAAETPAVVDVAASAVATATTETPVSKDVAVAVETPATVAPAASAVEDTPPLPPKKARPRAY
jgi:hypothetical protein